MSSASLNKLVEDHAELDETVEEQLDPYHEMSENDQELIQDRQQPPDLQESRQRNMESLLDCSPSDLHLAIERLAAIKRSAALDLIRKRRCVAMEERCPSLVGCNWECFPPKRVKRAIRWWIPGRVVKRRVELETDSGLGGVERNGVGSEMREPSEVEVSQGMEVEQPGSGPGPQGSFKIATNSVD